MLERSPLTRLSEPSGKPDFHAPRRLLRAAALFAILLAVSGCATAPSFLYPPTKQQTSALRLAEVMQLATREQIVGFGKDYQRLLASGYADSQLVAGSVAAGQVYCCGGLISRTEGLEFYVPPDLGVYPGDIVEVRLGREASKSDPGVVNAAIRVRERMDSPEKHCGWVPQNDKLWMRVLYCDWMESEGWTHKEGIGEPWVKLAPASK